MSSGEGERPPRRPIRWDAIVIAGLAAFAVASIGGSLTDLGPWYQNLNQPSWRFPDPVFPIAWTIIFALAAASGVIAWRFAPSNDARQTIIGLFAFNGFLNILWSLLFFQVKRPDWALYEVALLWLSVALLIGVTGRASRRAGWLLVPYLLWVSVAAFLNYEIVRLNAPFT